LICLIPYPHPHPASPPLPYTTLFRSGGRDDENGNETHPRVRSTDRVRAPKCEPTEPVLRFVRPRSPANVPQSLGPRYHVRPAVQDRKSTRLNSSHVSISYAVFCLKKK